MLGKRAQQSDMGMLHRGIRTGSTVRTIAEVGLLLCKLVGHLGGSIRVRFDPGIKATPDNHTCYLTD